MRYVPTFYIALALCLSAASSFADSLSAGAADISVLTKFIGDSNVTTQIFELQKKAGDIGRPVNQPWSGSYWPLHSGSVANPYDEGGNAWFNNTARKFMSVKANRRHFEKRMEKIRSKIDSLSEDMINELAPSEKYDLYLGDRDFSFTNSIWQSLMEQLKFIGRLTLWEGTCHGWATASIHEPRPSKPIRVMSLDGKYLIPFYPDDLKALATILYGNSLIQDHTVMQGMRCQSKKPQYDSTNGKVLNTTCQGVNAGDFHITLLEMVGARKQSFVINRTNNTQVWNQPIASYELKYFNPATGKEDTLDKAIMSRSQFKDAFANYRAEDSRFIVGVNLMIRYSAETNPDHRKSDEEKDDKIKRLELHYDLELDANQKIIGGEWRSGKDLDSANDESSVGIPKFPGFIWKFESQNPVAYSIADNEIPGDDPAQMNYQDVIGLSKKASQFRYIVYRYKNDGTPYVYREELRPQPLAKVVNSLLKQSHSN